MSAVSFRLNVADHSQYLRWENRATSCLFAADDVLAKGRPIAEQVMPEAVRIKEAMAGESSTASWALNAEIVAVLALKVFIFASTWAAYYPIMDYTKPVILGFLGSLSYASPISWVAAVLITTIATTILSSIGNSVLEPFRQSIIETNGFKFLAEIEKVRGYMANLRNGIQFIEEEKALLFEAQIFGNGMTEEQKEGLHQRLSFKERILEQELAVVEAWYLEQNVTKLTGWHAYVAPLLQEKDFSQAIFQLAQP